MERDEKKWDLGIWVPGGPAAAEGKPRAEGKLRTGDALSDQVQS